MDIYIVVAFLLLVLAYVIKEHWAFFFAGTCFVVNGGFLLKDNTTSQVGWYYGLIFLGIGLICIMSPFWTKGNK